jgi:secreted Zn-dependent insulinase-like peptidase
MSLLRTSKFSGWVFSELEAIMEARFRFAQKRSPADYVSSLAENLALPCSKDRMISGKVRLWKWDELAVREMLERDLAPEAVGLTLLAKDLSEIGLDGTWSEELWYKTKYQVFPLDGELVEKVGNDLP